MKKFWDIHRLNKDVVKEVMAMRKYYAAYNRFGTHISYDSMGWEVLVFASKNGRDRYLEDFGVDYQRGNCVAEAVSRRDIPRITKLRKIIRTSSKLDSYDFLGIVSDTYLLEGIEVGEI